MINQGDSIATVKTKIADALALVGVAAPTSWSDSHNKINNAASGMSLPTITDGLAGGTARARINAVIAGLETPANVTLPTITGDAVQGETLTTTTGTWTGLAPITYAYQWFNSDADITGATASTYVLTEDDIGLTVGVRVTATNVRGPVGVESDVTAPVTGGGYDPVAALGAKLLAYWDAEDAGSLTLVGGKVSAHADLIGGYSPAQGTDAARPIYQSTGLNGRPCIEGDGVAQFLEIVGVPVGIPTGSAECEIWYLGEQKQAASDTTLDRVISYGNEGTNAARYIGRVGNSGFNRLRVASGNGTTTASAEGTNVDLSGIAVVRGRFKASELVGEINDQVDGQASNALAGTATTRLRFLAGSATAAAGHWKGTYNKFLITEPLTDAEADRLWRWLATLGGVALYSPFEETADPLEWEAISEAEPYVFNSTDYHIDSAAKPYSIMAHKSTANFHRFEIREGDEWLAGDGARPDRYDRAELGTYWNQPHSYGEEQWYSFSLKARGVYSDGTRSLFQLFNEEVELQMVSTPNALFWRTYAYPDGTIATITPTIRHTAAGLVDDVPENFVIRALPTPSGGELQVWRNGVSLFNVTGIAFGTNDDKKTHKFGPYRLIKPDPFIMEIANFEWADGTDALLAKVSSPDAWPALWSA